MLPADNHVHSEWSWEARWCSHLELDWRNALFRRLIDMITDHFTVIHYDRPGTLTEPVLGMYRRLLKRTAQDQRVTVVHAAGDALPVADSSVDTVV